MYRPHFTMKFLRRCPSFAARCLPRADWFLFVVGLLIVGHASAANVPPTVILTNPASVFTFAAPVNITFGAAASDTDGTVAKVEFFQGATKLGEDTNSPYSIVWSNVPPGNYAVRAVATDNEGATNQTGAMAISVIAPGTSVWVAYNDHSPGVATSPSPPPMTFSASVRSAERRSPPAGHCETSSPVRSSRRRCKSPPQATRPPATIPTSPVPEHPFSPTSTASLTSRATTTFRMAPIPVPRMGCTMTTNGWVTYTFTNLDPNRRYSFKGAVNRGIAAYTNRWTLVELLGASSFVSAHSTGVLTTVQAPTSLAVNQAAGNFGFNTRGDIINWENIDPGPDGSFSIVNTRYVGFVPNGSSTNGNPPYGYAITEIRLQEFTATANQPLLLDARKLTNGNFQLTLTGTIGQKYSVERSLNLSGWTNLVTFTNLAAQTILTDTNLADVSARFYRGRLVP